MILAVLHDVVEDTTITLEDLRARGFSEETLKILDLLTHRKDEPYEAYLAKIMANATARKIKIADLEDNMDIRRLVHLEEKDRARLQKYRNAWEMLRNAK